MHGNVPQYDASNTMFSPKGRLFQVEYAREAIKKGSPALAMKYEHGVVFVVQRPKNAHIDVEASSKKLFRVTPSIGAVTSGLMADARVLVDYCRRIAVRMKMRYGEPIKVERLVKRLGDVMGSYTQHGGVRPFGVALLIGGIDSTGVHLYEADISGAVCGYKANIIGKETENACGALEARYRVLDTKEEALTELLRTLRGIAEEEENGVRAEAMWIDEKDGLGQFKIDDIDAYIRERAGGDE